MGGMGNMGGMGSMGGMSGMGGFDDDEDDDLLEDEEDELLLAGPAIESTKGKSTAVASREEKTTPGTTGTRADSTPGNSNSLIDL